MKNAVVGLVALGAVVLAVGCGSGGKKEASRVGGDRVLKVGLVTDVGQLHDHGFNQLAFAGLQRAERRLGVHGRVAESSSAADYVPNLGAFAREGYDLVISVGFAQGDAVDRVATKWPKTRFAIIDVDQRSLPHRPENVIGLVFREQEVGYLAGYLAALVDARRRGPHVIGSVGGMKEPPVDRFIAGYQAGARKAVPRIKLLNGYSQSWTDVARCKELAIDQIAHGAGVVFQVAGACGLGALDAAKERHAWGVGVDADQSFLGPHVLTSAQKKVDQAVFLTAMSVKDGKWRGGRNVVFGLRQGGVGLGKLSPRAPKEELATLHDVERQIVAGKIRIPTTIH